jgi:hypothetical protein
MTAALVGLVSPAFAQPWEEHERGEHREHWREHHHWWPFHHHDTSGGLATLSSLPCPSSETEGGVI